VLAIVGVIAMACGVAHDAIQRWATQSGQTKIELAKINNSWTPTNPPGCCQNENGLDNRGNFWGRSSFYARLFF